jgi:hypothetical protein
MSFSTNCSNLFSLAHTKLRSSFRGENWRRVVLHKTILLSPSQPTSAVEPSRASDAYHDDDTFDESSDDVQDVAHDYLFPDAGNLVEYSAAGTHSSEAQWLDSLLESLGDDDDDYFGPPSSPPPTSTTISSGAVVSQKSEHEDDEEDEHLFSPSTSPMSSSDDLSALSHQYYPSGSPSSSLSSSSSSSSSVQYPYISPYPPFHPPLSKRPYTFVSVSHFDLPPPYEDPLPFSDDVDDMPVPDAIEDTSDDESDAPPTPSIGGSRSSLYSVLEVDVDVEALDAASIPLPRDRSSLRHALSTLRGCDPLDDFCLYHYHPFSNDALSSYNLYSEC